MSEWAAVKRAYNERGLALFADESVSVSADVADVAPFVDGVNIKLDKAGGLREVRPPATAFLPLSPLFTLSRKSRHEKRAHHDHTYEHHTRWSGQRSIPLVGAGSRGVSRTSSWMR